MSLFLALGFVICLQFFVCHLLPIRQSSLLNQSSLKSGFSFGFAFASLAHINVQLKILDKTLCNLSKGQHVYFLKSRIIIQHLNNEQLSGLGHLNIWPQAITAGFVLTKYHKAVLRSHRRKNWYTLHCRTGAH